MVKHFPAACAAILIGGILCLAQQASRPTVATLDGFPEQVKSLDEPALRVFLRLELATFLWADKSRKSASEAERAAAEALADLMEHERDVPELYAETFRNNLMALLELKAPDLAARLSKEYAIEDKGDRMASAYRLLEKKGGVQPAVEKVGDLLKSGGDPGHMITFFLHQLEEAEPDAVPGLLAEVLNAEERKPGSISFNTLFFLKHQFMKREIPTGLQALFLGVFVNAAQAVVAESASEQIPLAHGALSDLLPVIQRLRPALYPQASALAGLLAGRLPRQILDRDAVDERIRQSPDPLNQTITEAEAARDPLRKESLYTQAAQMALRGGKLKEAIDLITKVSPREPNDLAYRDQFLEDVAARALGEDDSATASLAESKIQSPFRRSSAAQKIAVYFFEANDILRAREVLGDALKLIQSADDGTPKVSSLLQLTALFVRVDDQRIPELTRLAVKALNDLPSPKSGDKARPEHVKALLRIAHNIIPAFRSLAQKDEAGTLSLANSIERKEIKLPAVFGASTAPRGSGGGSNTTHR